MANLVQQYGGMAAKALQGTPVYNPTQFQAPFSLGQLNVGSFNANDPRFMGQAQTYANQTMREALAAQDLARRQFADLYAGQREDVGLREDVDLQENAAAGNAAWNRIQNMGANTGLGYGPMAQRNLLTSSATNMAAQQNLMRQYANEMAGYGRDYGTQMYGSYNQDALARQAREANAIKYLYGDILPAQTNAYTANANARIGAYGANADYLNQLANNYYTYTGQMGDANARRIGLNTSMADLYAGLISPYQNVYQQGMAARTSRY